MKKQRKITDRKKQQHRYTESGKRMKKSTEEQKIYLEKKKQHEKKDGKTGKSAKRNGKEKKRSWFIHRTQHFLFKYQTSVFVLVFVCIFLSEKCGIVLARQVYFMKIGMQSYCEI